jgi:purine-binding chemotaxis protein CheW
MGSQEAIAADSGGQMLAFQLGAETYGVDIGRVKEIRGWSSVTRIPQSSPHVLGVLNLRGALVPIIDLRLRFALPSAEFSPVTVIIVLSLHTQDGIRECGVVVDSVSDVVNIPAQAVKPPSAIRSGLAHAAFIKGQASIDDHLLILLNIDELITPDIQASALTEAAA